MLYIYRFHLLEPNVEFTNQDQANQKYEQCINEIKECGVVRAAFDLTTEAKSISILCKGTKEQHKGREQLLRNHLLKHQIAIDERIDVEELITERHNHQC
ncbi:MAG: hypothetical protein ACRC0B_02215, partial [Legionella sp.]